VEGEVKFAIDRGTEYDDTTGDAGRWRAIGREGRIASRAQKGYMPTEDSRPPQRDDEVDRARLDAARIRLGLAVDGGR